MKFVENPNLPRGRVTAVIADYRIDKKSVETLNRMGVKVIFSREAPPLYEAVKGHPDMMLHHLGGARFIAAPEVYGYFKNAMPEAEIIKGSLALASDYPRDIAYNAAAVGDKLICRRDFTALEILSSYKRVINVRQGYGKCSVCVVSANAVITSDEGIYKAALENNIDALKIREGHITLKGMNYGFIGGASGLISNDILAVNGNLDNHPDCALIRGFCEKRGVSVISLNDGEITDIGSIIPVCE